MGLQLIGGSNGVPAQVTSEGLLHTLSTFFDIETHINYFHEESYTVMNTLTPSPSSDFFYIKNTNNNELVINALEFYCDADEVIELYKNPSGTVGNGNDITPANCNFHSNKQADGIFYSGENLTGLSSGSKRNKIRLEAGKQKRYTMPNWTIIPKNTSLKFYVKNGSSELDIWIQFAYIIGIV